MKRNDMNQTDWNHYYQTPYKAATFSRKIVGKTLIGLIKKYVDLKGLISIAELGGANSCFYKCINDNIAISKYYILDNNQYGLSIFEENHTNIEKVELLNRDILNLESDISTDLVFSVGLVEHFSEENTQRALINHLSILKPGGILIVSFPTPTFLYKVTRKISEILGLWIFHDERPLKIKEVVKCLETYGQVLHESIIWPIFLTQGIIVLKKNDNCL